MIRFVADGAQGRVLGLGFSFANLDLLAKRQPILFDLAPYGQSGELFILAGDQSDVTAATMVHQHVLGLTPRTLDALRQGQVFPVELSGLGVTALWQALLFAGPTEPELVENMRKSGLLRADTELDWGDYQRHERGEVPGCVPCAAREPSPPSPSPLPSSAPSLPPLWRVWALVGLILAIAIILGIVLSPSAAPR